METTNKQPLNLTTGSGDGGGSGRGLNSPNCGPSVPCRDVVPRLFRGYHALFGLENATAAGKKRTSQL